jgi:hypothetical protein
MTVVEKGGTFTKFNTQRLRTQIIRPDCFFAPPPACNVIFPEHYTQLTYDRSFIQEATRVNLFMYNVLVGPDQLLGTRYMAPSIGENSRILSKTKGKKSYRTLMDHELHTGIILRNESISNSAAGTPHASKKEAEEFKKKRISYAQRIALFHFYKYRYGGRQSSIAGRFNPFIVCGFPAVVITAPFIVPGVSDTPAAVDQATADKIQSLARQHGAPTHFLGMIASVTHSIDQSGGTTSVQMHHVRAHQGTDDEFVHRFGTSLTPRKKRIRVTLNYGKISGNEKLLKILVDVTPQGKAPEKGSATSVVEQVVNLDIASTLIAAGVMTTATSTKTVSKKVEKKTSDTSANFVKIGHIPKVDRKDVMVPFPSGSKKAGDKGVYGTIVGVEVLQPDMVTVGTKQAYRSVILHEEVSVQVEEGLPVEEVIRPSWFSSLYSNDNIGKRVYLTNLGCESIVDPITVTSGASDFLSTIAPPTSEGSDQAPDKPLDQVLTEVAALEKQKSFVSVEKAVNFLAYTYGLVKAQQLDVDEFVRATTLRPIATMQQMLGDPDLDDAISFSGSTANVGTVERLDASGNTIETTPFIGFHSMAVSRKAIEKKQLAGLVTDPNLQVSRIGKVGKPEGIVLDYDVRFEKLEAVLKYKYALETKRAFRG